MRVTRVFVDLPLATGMELELPADAAAYLARVLRLRPGDACVLFNGDGNDYDARLLSLDRRGARAEVVDARPVANESPLRIVLVQGIARGEKMDLVLQKATELGVAEVRPVDSERSEVRLQGERLDKRLAHWRAVVASACGQCGRARVPEVSPPEALDEKWCAAGPAASRAKAGIRDDSMRIGASFIQADVHRERTHQSDSIVTAQSYEIDVFPCELLLRIRQLVRQS